jgi:ferritin-like protein
MSEPKDSCVQPARGPILEAPSERDTYPETNNLIVHILGEEVEHEDEFENLLG